MSRIPAGLQSRVMSAEQAARLITSGMTLGMSGFTLVGYPKAIPGALAASGHAKNLTLCTGASVGDDMDGVMAQAGIIKRRYSYQSNKSMRTLINDGSIGYIDMHLSHVPTFINRRMGGIHIDMAVIECAVITEEGLIPAASMGASDAFVRMADKVIVELNETIPLDIVGMHDVFEIGTPPHARPIPIVHPLDRIGVNFIPCPPEKIAAIVVTDRQDKSPSFTEPNEVSRVIGRNIVGFLRQEVEAGRLPENLLPLQSGVGAVANAVLQAFADGGFRDLTMYTETFQDSALDLLDRGIVLGATTCAVSFSEAAQKRFYGNLAAYREKLILRSQELSNNPEVIRRLGLISMNTPIEVDIYGNVNSTHIAGSAVMNGIGGSGDFTRNAALNIFATESIGKKGAISCIVPMVSHVDHTEHDTQIVVTEQGVADLRWKIPQERAELLIENCAHPDYRPMLRDYLAQARKTAKSQHTPHDLKQALSWHQRFLETGSMK
ncbi:MAG: succinate CoA transferase [Gracilibacteraceae bacterium]|jgi:succinyl-CoA:acetate CoA-transferase|nr:succinate CoA transferase [Gracilibacteraceae bacterium]